MRRKSRRAVYYFVLIVLLFVMVVSSGAVACIVDNFSARSHAVIEMPVMDKRAQTADGPKTVTGHAVPCNYTAAAGLNSPFPQDFRLKPTETDASAGIGGGDLQGTDGDLSPRTPGEVDVHNGQLVSSDAVCLISDTDRSPWTSSVSMEVAGSSPLSHPVVFSLFVMGAAIAVLSFSRLRRKR